MLKILGVLATNGATLAVAGLLMGVTAAGVTQTADGAANVTSASSEAYGIVLDRVRACATEALSVKPLTFTELNSKFDRAMNPLGLLENLKRAADGNWLLQPVFFDDETLRRFFNGDRVDWVVENSRLRRADFVKAVISTALIPGGTVEVEAACNRSSVPRTGGQSAEQLEILGRVRIHADRIPTMTLDVVRTVFGKETENTTDYGPGHDLPEPRPAPPLYKGWVTYPNQEATNREGLKLGVRFVFALGGVVLADPRGPAVDGSDVVQSIALEAAHSVTTGSK